MPICDWIFTCLLCGIPHTVILDALLIKQQVAEQLFFLNKPTSLISVHTLKPNYCHTRSDPLPVFDQGQDVPSENINLPPPVHLGVDQHGRWRILPNGLPLNDRDYHFLGPFPSHSKYFIRLFNERQMDFVNQKIIKHIPYTEHADNDELLARSETGLMARNSLRNSGLKHLRLYIDVKLEGLDSNYCLTKGAGRPPNNLLKELFSSNHAKEVHEKI